MPFLIEKLRAADKIVAYEAVMALSEITGKHEMATDMASFERSPEQHVARWEKWYAESSTKLR